MIEHEHLAHIGIKGMHWGVIKKRRLDKKNSVLKKREQTYARLQDNERTAINYTIIKFGEKKLCEYWTQ